MIISLNIFKNMEPSFFTQKIEAPFLKKKIGPYEHGTLSLQMYGRMCFLDGCNIRANLRKAVNHINLPDSNNMEQK